MCPYVAMRGILLDTPSGQGVKTCSGCSLSDDCVLSCTSCIAPAGGPSSLSLYGCRNRIGEIALDGAQSLYCVSRDL